jgi:hypothetical protein
MSVKCTYIGSLGDVPQGAKVNIYTSESMAFLPNDIVVIFANLYHDNKQYNCGNPQGAKVSI